MMQLDDLLKALKSLNIIENQYCQVDLTDLMAQWLPENTNENDKTYKGVQYVVLLSLSFIAYRIL